MPIYEYICQDCSHKFSLLLSIFHDDSAIKCGSCGSNNVKKAVSSFSCSAGSEGEAVAPSSGFGGG